MIKFTPDDLYNLTLIARSTGSPWDRLFGRLVKFYLILDSQGIIQEDFGNEFHSVFVAGSHDSDIYCASSGYSEFIETLILDFMSPDIARFHLNRLKEVHSSRQLQ